MYTLLTQSSISTSCEIPFMSPVLFQLFHQLELNLNMNVRGRGFMNLNSFSKIYFFWMAEKAKNALDVVPISLDDLRFHTQV